MWVHWWKYITGASFEAAKPLMPKLTRNNSPKLTSDLHKHMHIHTCAHVCM